MASVIRGSDDFDSAIAKFDTAHSFTTNGYQKLSNGLIIQWFRATQTSLDQTHIYPISFNSVYSVVASQQGINTDDTCCLTTITTTSVTCRNVHPTQYLTFIAIGV